MDKWRKEDGEKNISVFILQTLNTSFDDEEKMLPLSDKISVRWKFIDDLEYE